MKSVEVVRRRPSYVVDSSVWGRLASSSAVQQRMRRAVDEGEVVMPTPILLEVGFAARSPEEWDTTMRAYSAFPALAPSPETHEIALGIQGALWRGGKVRAAGAFDVLVAALAIELEAVVLHYDADYQHIASVDPRLAHEWVAPRGSL